MTRRLTLSLLAIGGALAAAPAAQAAAPWLTPQGLSAAGAQSQNPDVAVNGGGSAVAAWTRQVGGSWIVEAATRQFFGSWAAPTQISGNLPAASAPSVQVAIDPNGNIVVAWDVRAAGSIVQAAVRPAAIGAWRPAETISSPSESSSLPDAGISGNGTGVAAWSVGPPTNGPVASERPAATGAWSGRVALAPPGAGALQALAVGSNGSAIAIWGTLSGVRQSAALAPGGGWSAPQTLPDNGVGAGLTAVVNGQGAATVLEWVNDTSAGRFVQAASRPPAGPWGSFQRIGGVNTSGGDVGPGLLGVDTAGDLTAVWQNSVPKQGGGGRVAQITVANRPASGAYAVGGSWSAPQALSSAKATAFLGGFGENGVGGGVVTWLGARGTQRSLVARVRTRLTQAWAKEENVIGFGAAITDAQAGIDSRTNAVASWLAQGRVRASDRPSPPGNPQDIKLSTQQLLINQRISQAAVRRANAITSRLQGGLTAADIRDGSFQALKFSSQVQITGPDTGAILPPNGGRPLTVAPAQPGNPGGVKLTKQQLLINQRISQAAVRRANAVNVLLSGGLTGGDIVDRSLGPSKLAPDLRVVSLTPGPGLPPGAAALSNTAQYGPSGNPRAVTLSKQQLLINQRISQAAVRRTNAIRGEMQAGITGRSFQPASIGSSDLAP
jgi:hypothetical protein